MAAMSSGVTIEATPEQLAGVKYDANGLVPAIAQDVATGDVLQDRRSTASAHPTEAISVAKRFQKEFGNADLQFLGPRGEGVLTISGGLASFPRDGATVEQLFERADLALRDAKGSGKNRIYLVGEPQGDIAEIG